MAGPGLEPLGSCAQIQRLGLNVFLVVPSILEEELPDEKDMNILLTALNTCPNCPPESSTPPPPSAELKGRVHPSKAHTEHEFVHIF